MIAVNVVCIRWYNHAGKRLESPEQIRYARAHGDAPVIYSMGCDDWYLSDQVKICTFGSSNAAHTAVLIGDSIAGQWTPAALAAVDRSGWRLIVLTKSSCPMVDEPFFYARIGREYTECATWRKQALQYLAQLRPDIVLMGTVATNEFTRSQWVEGSARVFSALAPSVGHIYLLRGTPRLPFDGPDCLAQRDGGPGWLAGLKKCDVAWHDEHDDVVYRWLQDASRSFGNVSTIDMNDLICPAGWCSAERNGIVVFRDSQHMTATFAATLGPALAQRIGLPAKQAPSANGHDVAIH